MTSFIFSRRAEADLRNIAAFTLLHWGKTQAVRYLNDLETCCVRLSENPSLGRNCDGLRPSLQRMNQGSHVIFYR